MKTGEKIRIARKKADLTQKEVSDKMGVTPAMLAQYETGKRLPKLSTLQKIAEAIGCSLSDLAGYDARISQKDWSAFDVLPGMNPAQNALADHIGKVNAAIKQAAAAADPAPGISEEDCLSHFRPLNDGNKEKAIDYMDYLKDRQG